MYTVLIIDQCHEWLMKGLTAHGVDVSYRPGINRGELLQAIVAYDGLVVRSKTQIDQEVIDAAPKLKWIARAGAGMDNVDVEYAESKGIICIHAGGGNADAVGEHTIAMLLNLFTRLRQADEQMRQYIWDREGNRGWELKGKTIGIMGFGYTGSAVARKLRGFEMNILAYDKYITGFGNEYIKEAAPEEIFEQADILSLHIPLTKETRNLVNKEYIEKFKNNIYIINLSRGEVLNTTDLVEAMKTGRVAGCGLDVLENEKLDQLTASQTEAYEYIIKHPATILSPHVGGWTIESYRNISVVLLDRMLRLIIS